MNEKTQDILHDLYAIDPKLKDHEDKLIRIVENLLLAKPDIKIDAEFANILKSKILSEPISVKNSVSGSVSSLFNMKNKYLIYYGMAFAVVVVAVVAGKNFSPLPPSKLTSNSVRVIRVASGAFGSLTTSAGGNASALNVAMEQTAQKGTESAVAPVAFGRGGGGVLTSPMVSVGSGVSGSSGTASADVSVSPAPDAKMMIYRPYQIKYLYKGDKLELSEKNLDVLRRIKPKLNTTAAVSALNKFSFGGLNLGSFSGSQVTNFELSQPDSKGYSINVYLRDGTISISQNYSINPCQNGVCPVYQPLRPSEMLADDALISLSNDFLREHGIGLTNYGNPEVDNYWRKTTELTEPGFAPYVPDTISVLYPQKISGTTLYDLGGGINGLRINVDVRQKKVTGVWNIINQDYEASSYEAETDTTRIIKIAENGGIYGNGYQDPNAEIIEVELGTPKRVFTNTWKSDGSGEVVVPALYFPIVKVPKGNQYYTQNAIIVPLIKELLQIPEIGTIQLMKESVAPASQPEKIGL